MRAIAVINQKGGVGKTTTVVNLGAALAAAGRRTVAVDLDPQANLTLHLGMELEEGAPSTYRVLVGQSSFAEAIRPTSVPGFSVVPTDIHLSGAEMELAASFGRETLLREAIAKWRGAPDEAEPADYLLLDCPPSLGLLSINALAAADEVFLAVQTEFFALQGMSTLVDVVELVQRRVHPDLEIRGIIPCLYDSRLRLAREVLGEIRRYFPGRVFRQAIGTNVKLAEAPSFGKTIFEYAPDSAGARDYRALAAEVLAQEPGGGGGEGASPPAQARVPEEPDEREVDLTPAAPPAPLAQDAGDTAGADRAREGATESPLAEPPARAPSAAPAHAQASQGTGADVADGGAPTPPVAQRAP